VGVALGVVGVTVGVTDLVGVDAGDGTALVAPVLAPEGGTWAHPAMPEVSINATPAAMTPVRLPIVSSFPPTVARAIPRHQ